VSSGNTPVLCTACAEAAASHHR